MEEGDIYEVQLSHITKHGEGLAWGQNKELILIPNVDEDKEHIRVKIISKQQVIHYAEQIKHRPTVAPNVDSEEDDGENPYQIDGEYEYEENSEETDEEDYE